MHANFRRIISIVFVITVVLAAWWYFTIRQESEENSALKTSGTIEATQVQVIPELGGRVSAVAVKEGDVVNAGDVLVEFDTALLQAQLTQAQAVLSSAQAGKDILLATRSTAQFNLQAAQAGHSAAVANLNLLQAGSTQEQVDAAKAQLAQAEANLQAVQATLNALTVGARPEEIAAARTNLIKARVEYEGLTVIFSVEQVDKVHALLVQAEDNLSRAQMRKTELEEDRRTAQAALDVMRLTVEEAQEIADASSQAYAAVQDASMPFFLQVEKVSVARYLAEMSLLQAETRRDYLEGVADITAAATDAAQASVEDIQDLIVSADDAYEALTTGDLAARLDTAWKNVQDAEKALNSLGRSSSPSVESLLNQIDASAALRDFAAANLLQITNSTRPEQLDAAQAQVDATQAQAQAAQAQVEASNAQIQAAQAQVQAAQAAVDAVNVQISKLTLKSPIDGVVLSRNIEPGEVASPGMSLLVIAQLDRLTITVYAPEDRYGVIQSGEEARVTVDSYPGEEFTATVTYIADRAEFTPRNVQTSEGRRTTVFAVRLSVANSEGKLKPGMPADVVFKK